MAKRSLVAAYKLFLRAPDSSRPADIFNNTTTIFSWLYAVEYDRSAVWQQSSQMRDRQAVI